MASLQRLAFSGAMLQRGFWLYVWEIETAKGDKWLYVGRTGDSSSLNAQSPFNRLSQHLGSNKHANALRRHLAKVGVVPEQCSQFQMFAYGPLHPEAETREGHWSSRDKCASLENAVRDALHLAGYKVLNEVHCRQRTNADDWDEVFKVFAGHFPELITAIVAVEKRNDELPVDGKGLGH